MESKSTERFVVLNPAVTFGIAWHSKQTLMLLRNLKEPFSGNSEKNFWLPDILP